MTVLGLFLLVPATIVSLVGSIMMIVAAFRTSVGWGLLVLFVPFGALVYIIMHWQVAKRSFFINLAGTGIMVLAVITLFAGSASSARSAIARAGAMPPGSEASGESGEGAGGDLRRATRPVDDLEDGSSEAGPAGVPPEVPAEGMASPASGTAAPDAPHDARASSLTATAAALLAKLPAWNEPEEVSLSASNPGGIQMKGLTRYVGQELIFVLKGGEPIRGKLLAAESESVKIERYLPSGTARFLLLRAELQEIRLAS